MKIDLSTQVCAALLRNVDKFSVSIFSYSSGIRAYQNNIYICSVSEKIDLQVLDDKQASSPQLWSFRDLIIFRWLLVSFDFLGAAAIFLTTLFSLTSFVSAGLAGLTITVRDVYYLSCSVKTQHPKSAMSFSMITYWTCRFYTSVQVDLKYGRCAILDKSDCFS